VSCWAGAGRGCAGGAGINLTLNLKYKTIPAGFTGFEIKLHGLKGGHSGVDIHLQRGNAIKLLTRALVATKHKIDFSFVEIMGGNMHNAIPREAFAKIAVVQNETDAFEKTLENQIAAIKSEFKPAEPDMRLSVSTIKLAQVLDGATEKTILNLLNALPHGVLAMSYDIPDLVETSSNLATVKIADNKMIIHVSNRSSVDSAIKAIQERVKSIGELAGAKVEELEGYPGWKPNLQSEILKVAKSAHIEILGKESKIKAVHAGLECGIIGEKYPGMDMVSLGPQIEYPHSPDERVRIGSVADFYKLLVGVIEKMAA